VAAGPDMGPWRRVMRPPTGGTATGTATGSDGRSPPAQAAVAPGGRMDFPRQLMINKSTRKRWDSDAIGRCNVMEFSRGVGDVTLDYLFKFSLLFPANNERIGDE